MKSRNAMFTALVLSMTLAAPLAFAQETDASQAAQAPTADTPADPAAQSTDSAAATANDPASAAAAPAATAQEAKQITWSDLDVDKDGKLTKDEAGSVQALVQVFDDADADKDGTLTPDEYKAYVAKSQAEAPQPSTEG